MPNPLILVCRDYKDQVNCSTLHPSPLKCNVSGHPTHITRYAVCRGSGLCDDGIDVECWAAEGGCLIHKHQFWDNHTDCPAGMDEVADPRDMTGVRCERRFSHHRGLQELPSTPGKPRPVFQGDPTLPLAWVMDGMVDCVDGSDENETLWEKCTGTDASFVYYLEKGSECEDVFLCPEESGGQNTTFIQVINQSKHVTGNQPITDKYFQFKDLCDRTNGCWNEHQICQESRGIPDVDGRLIQHNGVLHSGQCLPGRVANQSEHVNWVT